MKRAVFLDRDGVLVEPILSAGKPIAPLRLDQFKIAADASDAVARLRGAGLIPIVATNQPEVSRGLLAPHTLAMMHDQLRRAVPVEAIYICPHDSNEGCACHKPRSGLLVEAARDWEIDLRSSFLIGDRWRDVGAGLEAGCFTVLIEAAYSGPTTPHARARNLGEAVEIVLCELGRA